MRRFTFFFSHQVLEPVLCFTGARVDSASPHSPSPGVTYLWRRPKAQRSAGRSLLPVLPRASRICSPHLRIFPVFLAIGASGEHEQVSGPHQLCRACFLASMCLRSESKRITPPHHFLDLTVDRHEQSPWVLMGRRWSFGWGEMSIWNRLRKRAKGELWLAWTVLSVIRMLPAGVSWHF